jgi:hypothetical protein
MPFGRCEENQKRSGSKGRGETSRQETCFEASTAIGSRMLLLKSKEKGVKKILKFDFV